LLFLGRGRAGAAAVLITLQLIPPQWPLMWQENATAGQHVGPAVAALALSLYLFILLAHWGAFFTANGEAREGATAASRAGEAYR
jgi:hypothetical protein